MKPDPFEEIRTSIQTNLDFRPTIPNSPLVLVRLGHVLLIVAFLAATGTHWVVLQSVAWTTMLADNLRATSFTEAVQRTFDGKHPCNICKTISAGKKSEKKTEFPSTLKQLEFVSDQPAFIFSPPQDFRLLPADDDSARPLANKPAVPPPRSLSA